MTSHLESMEKGLEGVRAICILRKPKTTHPPEKFMDNLSSTGVKTFSWSLAHGSIMTNDTFQRRDLIAVSVLNGAS
ncbi:unnamed protein product [Camellia sinensis]